MRKLSDFYKSGVSKAELTKHLSSLTFVEIDSGVYDILGDVDFSYSGLSSLLEVATLLKELIGSEVPVWIRKVSGNFKCNGNHLTDLRGAPQYVGGNFYCSHNQLISLIGAPRRVEGDFDCGLNYLQTLQGAPERIGGYFNCIYNSLYSLEGAPKYVGGNFYCYGNPKKFTEEEVRKLVNIGGEVYV